MVETFEKINVSITPEKICDERQVLYWNHKLSYFYWGTDWLYRRTVPAINCLSAKSFLSPWTKAVVP